MGTTKASAAMSETEDHYLPAPFPPTAIGYPAKQSKEAGLATDQLVIECDMGQVGHVLTSGMCVMLSLHDLCGENITTGEFDRDIRAKVDLDPDEARSLRDLLSLFVAAGEKEGWPAGGAAKRARRHRYQRRVSNALLSEEKTWTALQFAMSDYEMARTRTKRAKAAKP